MHEDEIPIDVGLVRALVDRSLPECSSLPLSPLHASGSSNTLFRLGDELLVRDLAAVITALRDIAMPRSALADPALRWYRGAPLRTLDDSTRRNVAACRAIPNLDLDLDAALRVWDEAMALPEAGLASAPHWYHGDLLPENLLVRGGRLAAVLDFGGLGVGDPTVDLVVVWEVLDAPSRNVFRHAVGVDEGSWIRGRAWALALALMTFPYDWRTMPGRSAQRLAMARSVPADIAST